jgi:hypothetical protein
MSEENAVLPLLGIDGDDKMEITIEPQIHHMVAKVKFHKSVVDQINEEIDNVSIANAKSNENNLVGQFRQDERSAQLEMNLSTAVGTQFKTILNSAGTAFLNNGYNKKSYADCYTVWSNHCYSGDYNPLHEHSTPTYAGLSGFMWLKLPDEMLERQLKRGQHRVNLNTTVGQYDGWNHVIWGLNSKSDIYRLKTPCEEYVQPEIGTMYIFPKWLRHQVMPFYGNGERRSLGMNWNVIESQSEMIPDDCNRNEIYPIDLGGITVHVKLDDA